MRFRFAAFFSLVVATGLLAAEKPGLTPVTFHADWFAGAQFAGIYVALDQGFYQDAGLAVTLEPFAFGRKTMEQLDTHPDTAALGAIEGYIFLQERSRGRDALALAAMLQESPAGFMSLAETGIGSAADFAGKTIGVHKFGDPLYRWFVKNAGLAPDAATMVFVDDDIDRLIRGEVAAMQGYATEEFLRFQARVGDRARFISFAQLGFDSYSEILFTTRAQWQAHPAALRLFLAATRRGWEYALDHPADAVIAVQRRLPAGSDAAAVTAALSALRPYVAPENTAPLAPMRPEKWERMQAACLGMGFLKTAEPVENFLIDQTAMP